MKLVVEAIVMNITTRHFVAIRKILYENMRIEWLKPYMRKTLQKE